MAVDRANAIINEQIDLGNFFFKNNQLFDPFSITQVQILKSDLTTVVETIVDPNITKLAIGSYLVTIAPIALSDTYFDRWTFVPESGGGPLTITNSVQILDVSAGASAQLLQIRNDIRLDIGDDGAIATQTFSDAQLNDFVDKSLKRLAGVFPEVVKLTGGVFTEDLTDKQIALVTAQAECLIAKRSFREATGKGLKATLGPTSIDTTAKFSGLQSGISGKGGICTDVALMIKDYRLNGDPDAAGSSGLRGVVT